MNQFSVLFGVMRYEFRMQIRRISLWITFFLTISFILFAVRSAPNSFDALNRIKLVPLLKVVVYWTGILQLVFPIGIGVLLADRLPRDKRTRVDELFTATPGALSIRLIGKYLGSTLASLLPMFVIYCIGIGFILYKTQNMLTILYAVETFSTIVLPGVFFISAFSIACPSILWVPLYQFLYVGYWFWGNWLGPRTGIPTLSGTILTPLGGYASEGFFGTSMSQVDTATPLQAVVSILLLLGIAALVMFVLWRFLRFE